MLPPFPKNFYLKSHILPHILPQQWVTALAMETSPGNYATCAFFKAVVSIYLSYYVFDVRLTGWGWWLKVGPEGAHVTNWQLYCLTTLILPSHSLGRMVGGVFYVTLLSNGFGPATSWRHNSFHERQWQSDDHHLMGVINQTSRRGWWPANDPADEFFGW